jgi:hypothetical protein
MDYGKALMASELIRQLGVLIEKHGDLPICSEGDDSTGLAACAVFYECHSEGWDYKRGTAEFACRPVITIERLNITTSEDE